MAFLTSDFTVDMALVIKQHVFGYIIDLHPRGRGIGIKIAMFFLNLWMLDDDVIMTVQAFFHGRHPGKIGIRHIRMAVLALYLFDTGVNIVAERNGLFGSDVCLRLRIKKIQKGADENCTE